MTRQPQSRGLKKLGATEPRECLIFACAHLTNPISPGLQVLSIHGSSGPYIRRTFAARRRPGGRPSHEFEKISKQKRETFFNLWLGGNNVDRAQRYLYEWPPRGRCIL